jgi:ABC-type nickel/cobalt efflux system permease component RcnA
LSPFAIVFICLGLGALIFTAVIFNRRKALGLDVSGCQMVGQFFGCFCLGFLWVIIYCCLENQERSRQIANGGQGAYAVVVPGNQVDANYAQMPGQPATVIYQQPQPIYVAPPQQVYYQAPAHHHQHHQHHHQQSHGSHHGNTSTTTQASGMGYGHGPG